MYRHFLAIVMCVFVMLGLCACNKTADEAADVTIESTTSETEVVTEATEVIIAGVVAAVEEDGILSDIEDESIDDALTDEKIPQETKQPNTTEPTEPEKAEAVDNTKPTTVTEPAETTAPTVPEETKPVVIPGATQELTEYEKYNAMSGEEQMAFMQSMGVEKFFAWYDKAKAEYEALHPDIEIGDGIIDAGDLVG